MNNAENLVKLTINGKGRSILKKNSLIIAGTQEIKERRYEKKKSVCFT